MAQTSLHNTARERVARYDFFDESIARRVAGVAQQEATYQTYQEFFSAVSVPLEPALYEGKRGRVVPYIDVAPRAKGDGGVLVLFLPMGNSLDANQLYQVANIALGFPSYRIIAFGNPSGPPYAYKKQHLSFKEWMQVVCSREPRALASVELEYLTSQNIQSASFVGYSFGALKAVVAARYAAPQFVHDLILVDPVTYPRPLPVLVADFRRTLTPLGGYVGATGLATFLAARNEAARRVDFNKGLLSWSNLAAGIALSRIRFFALLERVIIANPTLTSWVFWAGKSELGNSAVTHEEIARIHNQTVSRSLYGHEFIPDKHAFANDIHLMLAILYKALKTD